MIFSFFQVPSTSVKVSSEPPQATTNSVPTVPQLPSSDAFAAVAQLFQTTQGQQVNCLPKRLNSLQLGTIVSSYFTFLVTEHIVRREYIYWKKLLCEEGKFTKDTGNVGEVSKGPAH